MKTIEALEILLKSIDEEAACFFTNGFISRLAFLVKDRERNFYMVGSMGLVSSVGLGAALNNRAKTIVFDGDGSILMNLGAMALIGHEKPENFMHIVLDNNCYASTGGQPAVSGAVDFPGLAKSAGYRSVFSFHETDGLRKGLEKCLSAKGPVLLHLRVTPETSAPSSRVKVSPAGLTSRMRKTLGIAMREGA